MAENTPKVPSLSDLPDPFATPDRPIRPEGPEALVSRLPQELQDPTKNFMARLAKTLLSQQSNPDGTATAAPEQVEFYKKRFAEILDSGLMNPHQTPAKKIT